MSVAIMIAGGVLLVALGSAGVAWASWRAWVRRCAVGLVGRLEVVESLGLALYDLVEEVAKSTDAEFDRFIIEEDGAVRRAFVELRVRSHALAQELDTIALPATILPAAEALADAAVVVSEEAETVEEALTAAEPAAVLMAVDLGRVRAYANKAQALLSDACVELGIEDLAVYGGGLYL